MYVIWFLIYIIALPIWNFVLPVYAFWHFDDFSWGQTRKIDGAGGDDHGKAEGQFDSSQIVMKSWKEYEHERIIKSERWLSSGFGFAKNSYVTVKPTSMMESVDTITPRIHYAASPSSNGGECGVANASQPNSGVGGTGTNV